MVMVVVVVVVVVVVMVVLLGRGFANDSRRGVIMTMIVTVVVAFQQASAPGDCHPDEERDGQADAVVLVELELREQVRAGDADEGSGTEGKRQPRELRGIGGTINQEEDDHANWNHEREEAVDRE